MDLGAEQAIAAEKQGRQIAVEIKSFIGESEVHDLELALGQFILYRAHLSRAEPERKLYLAVTEAVFLETLEEAVARPVLEDLHVPLCIFRPRQEVIVRWIR